MKHLLNIFSVFILSTTSISTTLVKDYTYKESNTILQQEDTIDLENLNLMGGEINLYKIKDKLEDQQLVVKTILMSLLPVNTGNTYELQKVIANVNQNINNWIIDLPQLPMNTGMITEGTLLMLYIGNDYQFKNFLTINNLVLKNVSSESKHDLDQAIKNKNLGDISDLTIYGITDKVIEVNAEYDITIADFEITDFSYGSATLIARKNSNYTGTTIVFYRYIFKEIKNMVSKVARADAYNSIQWDEDYQYLNLDISLGKDTFLKKYSKMSYSVTGYNWDNNGGTWNLNSSNGENVNYKDLSLNSNDNILLFNREYHNVNWMISLAKLETRWVSNYELEIKLFVQVKAYATAWNAYWAKSEAQVTISEINFF
ncbi:hypothetical protein [Spiroplasma chrysopicola]|uniref:Uncharacterized protein n=1 Tax=Spiroplasma chrysopicola DF-1 TaxID=1276227 RepID=R4UBI2_9MOLU|nr:hypothetical protein [Spiroplasma chrysopicola]AGM25254.1 hypothetical protein SCHRY_v1c06780 [Spiroplasma chrysopicola DF-1]